MQKPEEEIANNALIDNAIIEKCKSGDVNAFKKLMDSHIRYVSAVAFKYLWNKEDVEEVVQETFIKVWRNIKTFETGKRFSTWVYKITVNNCIDLLRKQKHLNEIQEFDETIQMIPVASNSDQIIAGKELLLVVRKLAEQLSTMQRIVFTMIDLNNKNIDETSETLGISTSSVKANLSYARKEIRTKLVKFI